VNMCSQSALGHDGKPRVLVRPYRSGHWSTSRRLPDRDITI
jgi:hypothetical protein